MSVFSFQFSVLGLGEETEIQDFRKLKVWEAGHALTLAVYAATARFPRDEIYGLTSQIRRSASSIPSNIAEGCGRDSAADLARFLHIAMGSASELDYQLQLAHELGYLVRDNCADLEASVQSLKRMLAALIATVRVPSAENRKPKTENSNP